MNHWLPIIQAKFQYINSCLLKSAPNYNKKNLTLTWVNEYASAIENVTEMTRWMLVLLSRCPKPNQNAIKINNQDLQEHYKSIQPMMKFLLHHYCNECLLLLLILSLCKLVLYQFDILWVILQTLIISKFVHKKKQQMHQ